jgi:acetolactate synthase-1/2/3 large subunit
VILDPVAETCGSHQSRPFHTVIPSTAKPARHCHLSIEAEPSPIIWNQARNTAEVTNPDSVPEAVANAFRAAVTEPRGAVALVLANDVTAAPTVASIAGPTPVGALGRAPTSEIERAARLVRSARRPVLLVGARGADVAPCAAVWLASSRAATN